LLGKKILKEKKDSALQQPLHEKFPDFFLDEISLKKIMVLLPVNRIAINSLG